VFAIRPIGWWLLAGYRLAGPNPYSFADERTLTEAAGEGEFVLRSRMLPKRPDHVSWVRGSSNPRERGRCVDREDRNRFGVDGVEVLGHPSGDATCV